jgi:hypothetical protein
VSQVIDILGLELPLNVLGNGRSGALAAATVQVWAILTRSASPKTASMCDGVQIVAGPKNLEYLSIGQGIIVCKPGIALVVADKYTDVGSKVEPGRDSGISDNGVELRDR